MKYFWYLPKNKLIFFLFFSVKGKNLTFFLVIFDMGKILGVNTVCAFISDVKV